MINDLEAVFKSARFLLFADDLKLVYGVELSMKDLGVVFDSRFTFHEHA